MKQAAGALAVCGRSAELNCLRCLLALKPGSDCCIDLYTLHVPSCISESRTQGDPHTF